MYWQVLGAGTWYIRVTQTSNTNNTFDLKWWVKDAPALVDDDYGAGVWTTGTVDIDGSTDGTIKSLNKSEGRDYDWFAVEIEASGKYEFNVLTRGANTNKPSLILRKAHGDFIEYQSDRAITYDTTRGSTGRHFLEVRGKNGDYTVTASRLSVSEPRGGDLPANSSTTGYVQPNGAAATGKISTGSDKDWFNVPLTQGRSYRIDLKVKEPLDQGGTLSKPMMQLFFPTGSSGTEATLLNPIDDIVEHDGRTMTASGGGEGINARFDVELNTTGVFQLSILSPGPETGTYTVKVTEISVAEAQAMAAALELRRPRGAKTTVSEGSGQDLPNFLTSTGYVQVNGDNATGRITSGSDPDVFAVVLDEDHQYKIEVWGDDSTDDGGTLNDPKVALLNPSFDPLTNPRFVEDLKPSRFSQGNRAEYTTTTAVAEITPCSKLQTTGPRTPTTSKWRAQTEATAPTPSKSR